MGAVKVDGARYALEGRSVVRTTEDATDAIDAGRYMAALAREFGKGLPPAEAAFADAWNVLRQTDAKLSELLATEPSTPAETVLLADIEKKLEAVAARSSEVKALKEQIARIEAALAGGDAAPDLFSQLETDHALLVAAIEKHGKAQTELADLRLAYVAQHGDEGADFNDLVAMFQKQAEKLAAARATVRTELDEVARFPVAARRLREDFVWEYAGSEPIARAFRSFFTRTFSRVGAWNRIDVKLVLGENDRAVSIACDLATSAPDGQSCTVRLTGGPFIGRIDGHAFTASAKNRSVGFDSRADSVVQQFFDEGAFTWYNSAGSWEITLESCPVRNGPFQCDVVFEKPN